MLSNYLEVRGQLLLGGCSALKCLQRLAPASHLHHSLSSLLPLYLPHCPAFIHIHSLTEAISSLHLTFVNPLSHWIERGKSLQVVKVKIEV